MGALRWTLVLAVTQAQALVAQDQDPAEVVRQAITAVEADTVDAMERRWRRALARDDAESRKIGAGSDRVWALGLATLAHHTYRDSLADALYREVLANTSEPGAASEPPADRVAGYAALGLARLASFRERMAEADSIAGLAIAIGRASGDADLLGEALIVRGGMRFGTHGGPAARRMLAEAEAVLPADAHRARSRARCELARVLGAEGETRAAVQAALEGAERAERASELRAYARCQARLGAEYMRLFVADSALLAYEQAIEAYGAARDRAGLAQALQWRAEYLRIVGEYGQARIDAAEAVAAAEAAGRWATAAWSRLVLAQIALAFGDLPAARREATEVTRLFDMLDDGFGRAVIASLEANLAMARRDPAAATDAFERVTALAAAVGWDQAVNSGLTGLAWAALAAGDSAAAYRALDAARAHAREPVSHGRPPGFSLLEGTLALRHGRLSEAEAIFRQRTVGAGSGGTARYLDRTRLAEVLVALGRLDEAEREIVAAAAELNAWRRTLDDRRLRLMAVQRPGDLADPDGGVATVVAALASAGRLEPAFEVVELGRARELSDRMTRASALDTIGGPVVRDGAPGTLDSLRRVLPDDSIAIFEYVTGRGDPTTLFVVTRRRADAFVLPSQDSLATLIRRFSVLLESGEDPRALGRDLGDHLLAPALADLDPAVRQILVVPDGPLHHLPFDALVLPDGRFVVEQFAVASVPSAAIAARLWTRRQAESATGMAVLADPRFAGEIDAPGGAAVLRSAFAGEDGLPRLPGSSLEARAVARYSDAATVLLRDAASEAWLKTTPLGAYGVVHFATHALVDEGSMAGTALALTPSGAEDGFVRPAELARLRFAAELVVLSACRTAGGVVVRGEGVQGLAAPLLEAGARSVAVTWWPIGDAATVRLIDDAYRAMADGRPAGEALRRAKLAALERGVPAREWAALTLVGDPLARPPVRRPPVPSPVIVAGVAGVVGVGAAILAYGVAMRRRRASDASVPSARTARTHQR